MEISDWQENVDNWIKTIGVRYFNELTNVAVLMEEMGEFARLMARKYGEQSFKNPIGDDEIERRIEEELSDIFFVLTCLANQMNIDLAQSLEANLAKKTSRDADRHHANPKLKQ